ncbi:Uncharacterised protein [Neisseria gonorrhoeae]|uniref:Uncharacterized protein n=1 Tax=Neisseria gonorrhoeae TaxID=485 RepID=A0A378VYL0_NEIGO|nr:Uncharacterised protein [Neisseria gonorrhoeae]
MVIREIAVHFAEKFGHFVAQTFVEFAGKRAAHAVARVDGDVYRAFEFDVSDDVVVVCAGDVFSVTLPCLSAATKPSFST